MAIIFFSGSTRKESYNTKLVNFAYNYALSKGIESKMIDLKDYEMPIYQGDWEDDNGIPQNAKKLKQIFINNQGLYISTPEYNGFFPPLLKNTLDWLSRPETESGIHLNAFQNKFAIISAASPGKLGGIRALPHLRHLLNNLGVNVLHNSIAIPFAEKNFDNNGELIDENLKKSLFSSIDNLKNLITQ